MTSKEEYLTVMKKARIQAFLNVNKDIQNKLTFSCQTFDLSYKYCENIYMPTLKEAHDFINNLFQTVLDCKQINNLTHDSMLETQQYPNYNLMDIILIMITSSTEYIHIGLWIPEHLQKTYSMDKITSLIFSDIDDVEISDNNNLKHNYWNISCKSKLPNTLSINDLQKKSLEALKKCKIS